MSTENNKALTRRFYEEVLGKGDVAVVDDIAVADYQEHDPLPGQGTGRAGLIDRVTALRTGMAPQFSLENIIAEGDMVAVRWSSTGTHVGEFLGIPPTGKTYTIHGIDIYRVDNDRLAEHWDVVDQLSMLQQLGLLPTPQNA